jgi:hypothetical protein
MIKSNDNDLIKYFREYYYYDYKTGELHNKKDTCKQRLNQKAGDIATSTCVQRTRKMDNKKLYVKYLYDPTYKKTYLAHRVVWALHYDKFPDGVIDHIDGDPSNNRLDNLRSVDQSENNINRRTPLGHNSNGIKNLHVYDNRRKMYGITIRYKNYLGGKNSGTEYRQQFVRLRDAIAWRNEHLKKLNMPYENIDFNEWITDTPGVLGTVNPRQKNVTPYAPKYKVISDKKRDKIIEAAKTGEYTGNDLSEKFNITKVKIREITKGIKIPYEKSYDIKQMIELAKIGKYTRRELAKIFDVSYATIITDLKNKNIKLKSEAPVFKRLEKNKNKIIDLIFTKQYNIPQLCSSLNCSTTVMRKFLKDNKLKTQRKNSEHTDEYYRRRPWLSQQ